MFIGDHCPRLRKLTVKELGADEAPHVYDSQVSERLNSPIKHSSIVQSDRQRANINGRSFLSGPASPSVLPVGECVHLRDAVEPRVGSPPPSRRGQQHQDIFTAEQWKQVRRDFIIVL